MRNTLNASFVITKPMKYSILVPTYKAKYLSKCIDSILSQTYDDFELIIVNDASPEDIDSIIDLYNDERIKYYRNDKNCGAVNVVDNWNICLSYAKGNYVMCMGDDDELSPTCLEEYNRLIAQYPDLNIYHGRVKVIDEDSNFYTLQEARPEFESVYSMIWHRMKGRIQYIGDFLYKRSSLNAEGGFYKLPLAWGSDDISAFIAAENRGIANTITPIFYYRENRNTITSTGNSEIKLQAIELEYKWYLDFIANSHSKDLCELDNYYISLITSNLAPVIFRKKIRIIAEGLSRNICSLPSFMRMCLKSKISIKELISSIALSIYYRSKA